MSNPKDSSFTLWCEDCIHFGNTDMGGEGICDIDNHDTWYAAPTCENFKSKENTNETYQIQTSK